MLSAPQGGPWTATGAFGSLGADLACMASFTAGGSTTVRAAGSIGVLLENNAPAAGDWRMLPTGTTDAFRAIAFFDALHGVALMDSATGPSTTVGVLRHTQDGGQSWTAIGLPGFDLAAMAEAERSATTLGLVAVGTGGTVVRVLLGANGAGIIPMGGVPDYIDLTAVWAGRSGNNLYALAGTSYGRVLATAQLGAGQQATWTPPYQLAGSPSRITALAGRAGGTMLPAVALKQNGNRAHVTWDFNASTVAEQQPPPPNATLLAPVTATGVDAYSAADGSIRRVTFGGSLPFAEVDLTVSGTGPAQAPGGLHATPGGLWSAGPEGALFRAAHGGGGYTWADRSDRIRPLPLRAMDKGGQVAVGDQGLVYLHEGGTWRSLPTGHLATLRAVCVGSSTAAVAGDGGTAFTFQPAAPATLHDLHAPTGADLHAVALHGSTLLLGGTGGLALRTQQHTAPQPLFAEMPANGGTLRAALAVTGGFLAVGDGARVDRFMGSTRLPVLDVYTPPLRAVDFTGGTEGYVVGDKLTARHTTDGGLHWRTVPLPAPQAVASLVPLNAVKMLPGGGAWAVGNGGTDALFTGDQWTGGIPGLAPTGTTDLYALAMAPSGAAVVVGEETISGDGSYFRCNATGTWTTVVIPDTIPYTAWNFPRIDGKDEFIIGGEKRLAKRLLFPGGSYTTFKNDNLPAGAAPVRAFWFHDHVAGFAVTADGELYRTDPSTTPNHDLFAWGATMDMDDGLDGQAQSGMWPATIGFSDRHHGFIGGSYNGTPVRYARNLTDESGLYSQRFWYDALGRIVLSQNTKQLNMATARFSYTLYDQLGRVEEAGEVEDDTQQEESLRMAVPGMDVGGVFKPDVLDPEVLKAWVVAHPRREVTRTFYDAPGPGSPFGPHPTYRLRVATTAYYEAEYAGPTPDEQVYDHATHYRYDIHGNVKELVQDHPRMALDGGAAEQGHKRLEYRYDLVSGNVREVAYQRGWNDALHHRYGYDADSRLTRVEASADGVDWTDQANYFYYPHGPLERMELGHHRVQGVDYAYTLQGWLKGVNSELLLPGNDQGQDGLAGTANALVGRDAFGFSLGYYGDADYQPISAARWATVGDRPFAPVGTAGTLAGAYHPLYNGNIAHGSLGLQPFGGWTGTGQQGQVLGKVYAYDQLNRLRTALGVAGAGNTWQDVVDGTADRYRSAYTYDANGNIRTADRYDQAGAQYDAFSYKYQAPSGRLLRNRLYELFDAADQANALVNAGPGEQAEDIKYTGTGSFDPQNPAINTAYNYGYDALGNLVRDTREGITGIGWTVAGKVRSVAKATGPSLQFGYGAGGQRILKQVGTPEVDGTGMREHYVHDAQGNVMAIYRYTNGEDGVSFKVAERPLYGSTRLGLLAQEEELYGESAAPAPFARPLQPPGLRYELTDHLGTVKTVVSGRLLHGAGAGSAKQAEVLLADDHEPFGALLPGRNYRQPVGGPPPPPVTPKGVLVLTEFSNGPSTANGSLSGECEYVELYVTKCALYSEATEVDIRGWLIDDNAGNFNTTGGCTTGVSISSGHLRFVDHATWASVPVGTVIVVFNGADNCYNFTSNETGSGGQYFINVGSSTLIERTTTQPSTTGCDYCGATYAAPASNPWNTIALGNTADAIQVRCPDCPASEAGFYHGVGYGSSFGSVNAGTNDLGGAHFSGSGAERSYALTGTGCGTMGTASGWTRYTAPAAGTPPATAGVVDAGVQAWLAGCEVPCCGSFEPPAVVQKQGYRFAFQGQEKDDEVYGATGTSYAFEYRMHDPRVGRFLSIDPLAREFAYYSPYIFAGSSPIAFIDLDGLERVSAITFNSDVNYRAGHLRLMNGDDITRKVLTTNPAGQMVEAFREASSADPNGIGFVGIWGHGIRDLMFGSDSRSMVIDDLAQLEKAVASGDIQFAPNATIYIGNCNAGTLNDQGDSFAQRMADITGARVIAGSTDGSGSGRGSVGPLDESNGNMKYTMSQPAKDNFRLFQRGEQPFDLGGSIDLKPMLERAKTMPLERMTPITPSLDRAPPAERTPVGG